MSSSELSNALNPNIVSSRSRNRAVYQPLPIQQQPSYDEHPLTTDQPRSYLPHRSELELAIAEPSQYRLQQTTRSPNFDHAESHTHVVGQPFNAVQELVRALSAAREAAETERRRHLAWEREQEAKFAQRQAEMERQVLDMRQEISVLKAYISLHPSMDINVLGDILPSPARIDSQPVSLEDKQEAAALPVTPVSEPCVNPMPQFVQGSSSQPLITEPAHISSSSESSSSSPAQMQDVVAADDEVLETHTQTSQQPLPPVSPPISSLGKRPTPSVRSDENEYSSSEESSSSSSAGDTPAKRVNGHDKRCLTIQHAMRSHLLHVMKLKSDKQLPDSHFEGANLSPEEPVRFVWDKTSKQSLHNSAMKARVIADIKANRRRYKHVPEKDFSKKNLDTVFDQAFTTLRQKFKQQRNAASALNYKRKDAQKAFKARRLQRKKLKLSNRSDTRQRLEAFKHPTFDGAFQVDCISSEESSEEFIESSTGPGIQEKVQILIIRGLPWRSSRLQRFFAFLDEEEHIYRSMQPKRGTNKKTRRQGPLREGFYMPPQGVASWMISQRWLRAMRTQHPELVGHLKDIIVDPQGFDWGTFAVFGIESDDDDDTMGRREYIPRGDTSYSLQNALQPIH